MCKWVTPLHLEILKACLLDYKRELHEKWTPDPAGGTYDGEPAATGHCEVVGTDPTSGDTVFSCLNVIDLHRSSGKQVLFSNSAIHPQFEYRCSRDIECLARR
jgi:hypothetical protein